ncbi:hypothetical protein C2E23DRAFT_193704 [Lenzites betulinus]|nr:hypothetical protein C2E23DRAFT_193704 [Lenzites betulinus]
MHLHRTRRNTAGFAKTTEPCSYPCSANGTNTPRSTQWPTYTAVHRQQLYQTPTPLAHTNPHIPRTHGRLSGSRNASETARAWGNVRSMLRCRSRSRCICTTHCAMRGDARPATQRRRAYLRNSADSVTRNTDGNRLSSNNWRRYRGARRRRGSIFSPPQHGGGTGKRRSSDRLACVRPRCI